MQTGIVDFKGIVVLDGFLAGGIFVNHEQNALNKNKFPREKLGMTEGELHWNIQFLSELSSRMAF